MNAVARVARSLGQRGRFGGAEVCLTTGAMDQSPSKGWDTFFYALDAGTGDVKWNFKTGNDAVTHNQVGIPSSPAVVGGVVYFGCRDSHVYAVDAGSGKKMASE